MVPSTSLWHPLFVAVLLLLAVVPVGIIFGGWASDADAAAAADAAVTLRKVKAPAMSFESPVAYTCTAMLATPEAWLLGFCGAAIIGSGNVLATNLAQIIESSGASAELVPTTVTLFSSANLLGRLLCNIPSDGMVRRGFPRPLALGGIAALAATAHLALFAAAYREDAGGPEQATLLQFGAAVQGLAFGALWPHLMVLTSELFGSLHLSINYMFFDGMCASVGTLLLANALPAAAYRAAAKGAQDCMGPNCFGPTHAVIAGLCVVAIGLSGIMSWRTAPLYRKIGEEQKRRSLYMC